MDGRSDACFGGLRAWVETPIPPFDEREDARRGMLNGSRVVERRKVPARACENGSLSPNS